METRDYKKCLLASLLQHQKDYICDGRSLLATLHQYQQTGHLCDVTLVSTKGSEFVAHAVVLAAASSVLTQELSECNQGHCNIVMPLNAAEIHTIIQFAYTGRMNTSQLCDMSKINYFCDRDDSKCHERSIIAKLDEFREKGLFSNVTWHNMVVKMQPNNSVLMAIKYEFMSQFIKTGSIVKVKMSNVNTGSECHICHKHFNLNESSPCFQIRDEQFTCDMCKICLRAKVFIKPVKISDVLSSCDTCGKHFSATDDLRQNERLDNTDKINACNACKQQLRKNVLPKQQDVVRCDDNVNESQNNVLPHSNINSEEESYRSDDDIFSDIDANKSEESLQPHITINSDEDSYGSDDDIFSAIDSNGSEKGLQPHITIHTDEDSYRSIDDDIFSDINSNKSEESLQPNIIIIDSDEEDELQLDVDADCNNNVSGIKLKPHVVVDDVYKPFICLTCHQDFRSKDQLNIHESIHKKHECGTCHKHFSRKDQSNQHSDIDIRDKQITCDTCKLCRRAKVIIRPLKLTTTGAKQTYSAIKRRKCGLCFKRFTSKREMRKHVCMQSSYKPYTCTTCSKSFSRKHKLRDHESTHSKGKHFTCSKCNKCYQSRRKFERHRRGHRDDRPCRCEICKKCFNNKHDLKCHEATHSTHRPYTCEICRKSFKTKVLLKCHKDAPSDCKPHGCEICSKRFTTQDSLKIHRREHNYSKSWQDHNCGASFLCKLCNKYLKKDELNSHIVHIDIIPGKCVICNKHFKTEGELTRHHKVAHFGCKIEPFMCSICDKGFQLGSHLKAHERYHFGNKPLKCVMCKERFKTKLGLRRHKLTHSGVIKRKPFICIICDKRFQLRSHLKVHESVHVNLSLYQCEICNRSFKTVFELRLHEVVHNDGICHICKKSFKTMSDLKLHVNTHQNEVDLTCVRYVANDTKQRKN